MRGGRGGEGWKSCKKNQSSVAILIVKNDHIHNPHTVEEDENTCQLCVWKERLNSAPPIISFCWFVRWLAHLLVEYVFILAVACLHLTGLALLHQGSLQISKSETKDQSITSGSTKYARAFLLFSLSTVYIVCLWFKFSLIWLWSWSRFLKIPSCT